LTRIIWHFQKLNKPIIRTLKNFKFNNNSLSIIIFALNSHKKLMSNHFTQRMFPNLEAISLKVIQMTWVAKFHSYRWNRGWWMNCKLNLIRMISYRAMERWIFRIKTRLQASSVRYTIRKGILTPLSLYSKVTKRSWWWINLKIKVKSKFIED